MFPSTRRLVALAAVTAGAVAVPAVAAQAAPVPLGSGATSVRLSAQTARAFSSLGVRASAVRPARKLSAGITFPVTGGSLDPATGLGTVTHAGGLRLTAGGTRVTLSSFRVRTSGSKTISVRVNGGARLNAFRVELGKARISRVGVGVVISDVNLVLTRQGARALNRSFGVSNFRTGRLGTVVVRAAPRDAVLTRGATTLALTPGASAALSSLGIVPGVTDGAGLASDGSPSFPITGGTLAVTDLAGTVRHAGVLTLTRGATSVALGSFIIDTKAATLSGTVNGSAPVPLLDLDLAKPTVRTGTGTVTVSSVSATLTAGAAAALNQAFGTTAFTPGLAFGTATIAGQTA